MNRDSRCHTLQDQQTPQSLFIRVSKQINKWPSKQHESQGSGQRISIKSRYIISQCTIYTTCYLKCSVFNKKLWNMQKTLGNVTYTYPSLDLCHIFLHEIFYELNIPPHLCTSFIWGFHLHSLILCSSFSLPLLALVLGQYWLQGMV